MALGAVDQKGQLNVLNETKRAYLTTKLQV
jgi:hypothetical protein